MMAGGHAVHEQQAILSITVVIYPYILYGERETPFGGGERNHTFSFVGQSTDKNKLRRRLRSALYTYSRSPVRYGSTSIVRLY